MQPEYGDHETSSLHESAALVQLKEQVDHVSTDPGCYLWRDKDGAVLYVGKAKNLRARMKQYVLGQDEREKIPLMMAQVHSFDYIVVNSEHESLVLEKNLIQQYHPPYNVDYRDDKSYPFIALTVGEDFPSIKYTREKHREDTRYFGPYTDSRAARNLIDIVRRIVPICTSQCPELKRIQRALKGKTFSELSSEERDRLMRKPCFDYHVGKGPGVCIGAITPDEYRKNVEAVERFLSGKRREFIDQITQEMYEAADDLDFEKAARCRNRIETIRTLQDKQQVVFKTPVDLDVIGFYREETIAGAHVFVVREGRVIISNDFVLNKGLDVPHEELVEGFLKRYYHDATDLPAEILVGIPLPDAELLQSWLSEVRTKKVVIHVPVRGDKKKLLELADKNARHALMRFKVRTRYDDERINRALLELESALALPNPPMRIECFDISTIHGKHSVASMVVFTNGKPDKSQYRRFKIRTETPEANDFLMMSETLRRRYDPERMKDERFGSTPDLLIVDGGKPQLTAALKELEALNLDIPVAGLAKSDEELFVPWSPTGPVVLPSGSSSLYLVKHVRDEAHRFAITFHRELRDKAMTQSILDEIEGVGPHRKKALLKHFGSFKRLKSATLEEIAQVPGISHAVAEAVFAGVREIERLDHDVDEPDANIEI